MSLGITPQEFVKQVFYMQEKVRLDFCPDDDVYKEVLMEANLVLQELQKEEDWLWLRETVPLGFTGKGKFVAEDDLFCHHFRRQMHPTTIDMPSFIYKPSELYGDCVRLCRYVWHRDFIDNFKMLESQFLHWNDVFSDEYEIDSANSYVLHGDLQIANQTISDLKYNCTYLADLHDVNHMDLIKIFPSDTWSLDYNGNVYVCIGESPKMLFRIDAIEVEDRHHEFDGIRHPNRPWVYHRTEIEHPSYEQPFGFKKTLEFLDIDEFNSIKIPYVSAGQMYRRQVNQTNPILMNNMPERGMGAIVQGNRIKFTEPLRWYEDDRIVLIDAQMRLEPFHICDETCTSKLTLMSGTRNDTYYPENPCMKVVEQAEKPMLCEIPEPMYVVAKTAAMHAEGSPPAQAVLQSLHDRAQKLLSSMRSHNAEFTTPDTADWYPMEYVNII